MKLVFFTEGRSDKETIKILIDKIFESARSDVSIEFRVLRRGDLLDLEKVQRHITLDILVRYPDVSKIILCVDSECTPSAETEKDVKKIEPKLQKMLKKLTVNYCIVVHALESWLTDDKALASYLGLKTISIPFEIEKVCKPKKIFVDVFKKAGRQFNNVTDNPKIAKLVNLEEILKKNKSFRKFVRIVKDP